MISRSHCCSGKALSVTYSECVCSLSYPACKAHVPYCYLWPVWLYHIYPHYLITGIGLEETIVKEIEQNQLTWYGHVQRMAEGRLPKIALKWMPKQKNTRKTEDKLDGMYKEGHERKKPN